MATNRSTFELLLEKYDPVVRAAFLDAINGIRSRVVLKRLVERLEKGDVAGAIDLLGIERATFGPLEMAISEAFNGGGIVMAQELKLRDPQGNRVAFQFGVRNLVAEAILRDMSSTLVTRVTDDQIDMLRRALSEGLERGDNPTRTALNMVGRVSTASGKRVGGYLGLSGPQERTSAKARSALISGDVQGMREYLALKQRDVMFDASVRKAIAEGKALSRDDVARAIGRMNDRQLKYRADKLALNETFGALAAAKQEGIRQAVESGKVDARFVVKKWRHSGKEHPRLQHLAMDGKEMPLGQPFMMADGTPVDYPHAPGTPARHTVGCGCYHEIRVLYAEQLAERRRSTTV